MKITLTLILFFSGITASIAQTNYLRLGSDSILLETSYYSLKSYNNSNLKVKIEAIGKDSFPYPDNFLPVNKFKLDYKFYNPTAVSINPLNSTIVALDGPYESTDSIIASIYLGQKTKKQIIELIRNSSITEWNLPLNEVYLTLFTIEDTLRLHKYNPKNKNFETFYDSLPNFKYLVIDEARHPEYYLNEKKVSFNGVFWKSKK